MKFTEVIWENYGGYAGRLRRLCGKFTEVIWENYRGYAGRLRRLCEKITEIMREIGETLPFLQLKPKLATIFFFQKCCFFGILLI